MTCILNLPGAFQLLRRAKTDTEVLAALGLVTEESYRTLAILFYSRYISQQTERLDPIDRDISTLILEHFHRPTFETWTQLGKLCGEKLLSMGDKVAKDYSGFVDKEIDSEFQDSVKLAIRLVSEARHETANEQSRITYPMFLELLRLIRELSGMRLFFGEKLRDLCESGLHEIVQPIMEQLMGAFDVRIVVPMAFSRKGTQVKVIYGPASTTALLPPLSERERLLYETYLWFYQNEDAFLFHTGLLLYDEETDSCYVYSGFKDETAEYDLLTMDGEMATQSKQINSVRDVFDIPVEIAGDYLSYETLMQRFGETSMSNGVIHNLRPRLRLYVRRPKAENELRERLSHRKFYITTLDGGGGFGKTEMARTVIWDIIEAPADSLHPILRYDHVVWVSGKTDYYVDGRIERRSRPLRTVGDLVDSILFVTNNPAAINKPLPAKKKLVVEALNRTRSTLILLDNLETVSEKEQVWEYLIELGDQVTSDLRVLATSRIRVGSAELVVRLREMERQEAEELALLEMDRLGVDKSWREEGNLSRLLQASAGIPLLIRHFVNLISRGHSLEEILSNLPADSDRALDFICGIQWRTLENDAKKLLAGIAYWGGQMTFAQAKLLCCLSDKRFQAAKEQLVVCSFLVDQYLIDSILDILPPIAVFTQTKLNEHPEFRKDFQDNENLLRTPEVLTGPSEEKGFTDEVALNQLFQRAELLARQGSIDAAHDWYKQGVERFPQSSLAWRALGTFEYAYLGDDVSAGESFRQATLVDPTDPMTYEIWAYWEYERGRETSERDRLRKSIRLYDQALQLTHLGEDRRRLRILIAESNMQLGWGTMKAIATAPREKKKGLAEEKNLFFIRAIDMLEAELNELPDTWDEKRECGQVCNLLVRAFLFAREPWARERNVLDDCAIYYMIRGLAVDNKNHQLRSALRLTSFIRALQYHGKQVNGREPDNRLISVVMELEDKLKNARPKASQALSIGKGRHDGL